MKQRREGGYAGMIGLLVGVAIIALLFAKVYLTPNERSAEMKAAQPLTASGTVATTEIEQMHADVDAANATRDVLNKHNEATNQVMQE